MSELPVSFLTIRRHSVKGTGVLKDMLAQEGIDKARRVGAEQMRGRGFTGVFVSPMIRTAQTAMAFIEGAGDVTIGECGFRVMPLLGNATMAEWIARSGGRGNLVEIEANDPEFIQGVEVALRGTYRQIINLTPEGGHALVVTHTPCLELAVRALTGQTIGSMKECEGVLLRIDGDAVTIVEELRLP